MARSVTGRERDREILREERARTNHMLRHVTDAIVLLDPDGVILENSDRSGRLLAVPPELVVPGQTHQNILRHLYRRGDYGFDLSEADFIARRRADVLAAGDLTFTAPMPNGVWAEYNFRPMPDGHMLIIVRDVTELKQQEQALVRARDAQALEGERLNAILDHLPDGVALTEADGELVHMNAASHELNHFPPLEAGRIRTMRDAMRWQLEHAEEPPGAAEIEADLDRWWTAQLAVDHDPTGLVCERNVFRYRPLGGPVLVVAGAAAGRELGVALAAARRAGASVETIDAADEPAWLRRVRSGGLAKIRGVGLPEILAARLYQGK